MEKTSNGSKMKVGPFNWIRRDSGGDECWDLVLPEGLRITCFAVKNYGGEPNDSSGFSGWRLVSGGPFSKAGGWTNRDDAMRGVIPFLIKYYSDQADERVASAKLLIEGVKRWREEIGV